MQSFSGDFSVKTKAVFIGSQGASICINGDVYRLIYSPRRPHERVTPADVRRVPWDAMHDKVKVIMSSMTRACVIRLQFSRTFQFQENHAYPSELVFAAISSASITFRRVFAARRQRKFLERESRVVRKASSNEDTCFDNFPNATFTPCRNSGVCCACAYQIVQSTKKCPLCRRGVTAFRRLV